MPQKSSKVQARVEKLLKAAASLSVEELISLKSGIDGLLDNHDFDGSSSETVLRDCYGKPANQRGYIEEKMINGYGPYRYLRYWDGKKHRSVYLGKSQPALYSQEISDSG